MQIFNQDQVSEDAAVGKLVNHIPELLVKKGWDAKTFVAYCMVAGMAQDTAYRLARGDTNVKSGTLQTAATVLGVSIGDILELEQ